MLNQKEVINLPENKQLNKETEIENAKTVAAAVVAFRESLKGIDDEQQNEGRDEHDRGHGGRACIVILFQLGDDDQRRDLRDHRQITRNEDDRAVLADRAREGQREAGQQSPTLMRCGKNLPRYFRPRKRSPAIAFGTSGLTATIRLCSLR